MGAQFSRYEVRLILVMLISLGVGLVVGQRWLRPPAPAFGGKGVVVAAPAASPTPAPAGTGRLDGSTPAAATATTTAPPADTAPPTPNAGAFTSSGRLDLNRAGQADLETLPGIGPSKARAILETRSRVGGFRRVEDLDAVPGIGAKTLESLRPHVEVTGQPTADPPAAASEAMGPVVYLNRATLAELDSLEGVGPVLAERILADRVINGPFRRIDDLTRVRGVGSKIVERNRHRLKLD